MKQKMRQTITVKIKAEEEQYVTELVDKLETEFPAADWDYNYIVVNGELDHYEITGVETAIGSFYPGVLTLPNGDPGYPDEFDVEFECYEGDVEDLIEHFVLRDEDIFTDWNVSCDIESWGDADD